MATNQSPTDPDALLSLVQRIKENYQKPPPQPPKSGKKPSAPTPTCKTLRSLPASSTSGRGNFCARPCKRARVCAFFLQAGFRALKGKIEKGVETRSWPPSFLGLARAEEIRQLAGADWRWRSGKPRANGSRVKAKIRGTIDEK